MKASKNNPFVSSTRVISTAITFAGFTLTAPLANAASGTWTGANATANWGFLSNWVSNTEASGAGFTATFGNSFTNGYTINLNANRTIGNITLNNTAANDFVINRINSAVLTLDVTSGSPTINVTNAARTLTLNMPIGGSDGMTKSGPGTLVLSGANTFGGGIAVTGGTLTANAAASGTNTAFGTAAATRTVTVNSGTNLRFNVANVFSTNFSSSTVPALAVTGTATNVAGNNALGNVTLTGGTLTATTGHPTYGAFNLNGTITSTGSSLISTSDATNGKMMLTSSGANGVPTNSTINVQSGTLTVSAPLADLSVAESKISGLTKTGDGILVLSGSNTYTGNTDINAGTLSIATTAALPGYDTNGRYSVAGGATLAVQNTVSDADIGIMLGTTNFLSGANLGFDTAAGNRSVAASFTDTAQGPLGIVKLGGNTLTLSGTNTHSGGTSVQGGALQIDSTGALPNWNVNGGFSVASSASLVIPNSIGEPEVTTILGTTNIAAGGSLLFDTSAGDRTYASALTDSASGLLNIGKIGNNALTLAGANTYAGNTTVTGGTLNVTGTITGNSTSSTLAYGGAAANTVVNVSNDITVYAITGANNAGSSAVYNQTAGTVTTTNPVQFGDFVANNGGYGYFNLTGGTFQNTQGSFNITNNNSTASTGVAYVAGNLDLSASTGNMVVAYSASSQGSVTVAPGGTYNYGGSGNTFFLTVSAGSYGVLNVAGGNADFGTRAVRVGNAGAGQTGVLNLAGGTLTLGQNFSTLASTSNFHVNHAGGTLKASANLSSPFTTSAGLTVTSTIFGAIDNSAAVGNTSQNFSGGLTVDTNGFDVSYTNPLRGATGNGVKQSDMTVTGGSGYTGAPMVVFTGGTLAPGGTPASGYALIAGGQVTGIVITSPGAYTADPTVTLTGGGGTGAGVALGTLTANAPDAGLVKTGSGTLTLPDANTYTGVTSVNAGTLNITGTLTSDVAVASGAHLGGEGSTTGSLTFSGNSQLNIDPGTGTALAAATVDATGAAVTVTPTIPFTGTGIVVLDAPGGITGTAGGAGNNFIYTGRGSLYFNNISQTQLLVDTAPVSLAWLGNDGTNPSFWDLNTTTNWDNSGSEKFFTGDAVTFDDTASSFTVNIGSSDVFPGNITFNNTATYTVQGAFGIYGGGTLTKNGTGTTVINTSNGYTGATAVNAGVLNIRTATALGDVAAGTSVASGAALEIQGGFAVGAEALTLDGSGISSNGALRNISGDNTWGTTVALAGASTIGVDADTLTLPSLTGAFSLTKVGAGTLNITGATAVTSTTVEAGTLYMGAQSGNSTTTTLGAANAVTLNNASNLTIRRTNTGGSDLTGVIGGSGSLVLLGTNFSTISTGDFILNNSSTYSGGSTINGARVQYKAADALGSGPISTEANGQVFFDTGMTLANNFTLGSGLGWNEPSGFLGALRMNNTTLSGTITLTADTRLTSAGSSILSGKISGGFGLNFFEDTVIGTITLSGANDYTGETTVNSVGSGSTFPNLVVANTTALGTTAAGTVVNGTGTTGNGSQLTLADGITVTDETLTLDATASGYRASLITASNATATWDGNVVTAGTGGFLAFNANGATSNLTVGASDADTITGTNTIAMRGTGTGTVNSSINIGTSGIFKTDASVWTITSNNNDFTGAPSIAGGVLSVGTIADAGVNSALGAGTLISLGQNSTSIGTLQFTGAAGGSSNREIRLANGTNGSGGIENTVSGQTLVLSGEVTSNTPANAHSLTLTGAGNGLLGGTITGSPAMSLVKSGAGTWELSGDNTHTGATTVTGGTLKLSGDRIGVPTGTTAIGGTDAILDVSGDIPMGATQFQVGNATGGGTVNQSAGDITFASGNQLTVGTNAANIGTYNLSGGTFTTAAQGNRGVILGVNANCTGIFNLSGTGVLDVVAGSSLQIARSENVAGSGATGTFNQTGGTATVSDLRMGGSFAVNNANQIATLDVSAGTFTATGFTALSGGDGSASTINISGTANVTLPAFPTTRGAGATAIITFDGGTLKNSEASSAYMGGLTEARIKAGGVTIDTTAGDITVSQDLLTDAISTGGGLNKSGSNVLTLAGANTYTGATLVSEGTLALTGGSQASAITVGTGASLGFTVGSTTTSTAPVDLTNGSVRITGSPTLASYTLMTASSITPATPALFAAVPGYELVVEGGTTLKLVANNTFATWIGGFSGLNGLTGFDDDADGDGLANGLENFFGTAPNAFSTGVIAGTKSGNTFTFTHPQNATPASDVSAPAYGWSTDLLGFNADGATEGGTKVDFLAVPNSPTPGITTVTATITGTVPAQLFINVGVTQQ